jgi:ABC-type multidrug transport system fused ATPase/permease subunit
VNIQEKTYHISPIKLLRKISLHLEKNRKKQVTFVAVLSFLSSLAESVSIALLIPFISFFINPETYNFNKLFLFIFDVFNINENKEILTTTTLFFILIVITSGLIRIKYIKQSNLLTDKITSDFRIKIFNFLLNQEYSYYFKYGSQEILSNLSQKTGAFTTAIFSAVNIFNAILISLAIVTILFINEPVYTPIIIFTIILFFYINFKIRSSSVLKKGQNVNLNKNKMIDIFENAVGYLPEIIIYNLKKFFSKFLSNASEDTAKSSSEIRTISQTPRIYLEVFVLVFVVLLVFFSNFSERQIENNITYLAILAFGAQKILPLINSIYQLSVNFKGSVPTVVSFLNILENNKNQPNQIDEQKIINKKFNFSNKLEIKNLSFRYNENLPKILNNVSFTINKGEKITIKGQTGSGKSTLVNIISGLLDPLEGKIIVDDNEINSLNKNSWQKNFAIVPQTVFLSDSSFLENIAIGYKLDEINLEKVKHAAKIAQIDSFIEKLPNQYYEKVGERGIRLSGGQRQRVGIARALYRNASIVILDEPTNALDKETEKLVMDSVSSLGKDITLIMISHSNNLLQYFDQVIDLDKIK